MYRYRIVFPTAPNEMIQRAKTAMIERDEPYEIGARIEHGGRTWIVTKVPLEAQNLGDYADLLVWPADA